MLSRMLFAVCLMLLAPWALAVEVQALGGYATQTVGIASQDQKTGKTIELRPLLVLPRVAGPWKVVVLPSNCSGARDEFWLKLAPVLLERGLAVALLDSFAPRGFADVCTNKFQMWQEDRVRDAVAVLRHLRADPRFDGARIALGGHSNGAVTAFMAAYAQSSEVLGTEPSGFAAYFGVGTSCEASFRSPRLWAPLLLISGEKDDYTFPEPCVREVRRLKAAGSPADILVLPGANHNMSTSGWVYSPSAQRMPRSIPPMYMLGRQSDGTLALELEDGTRTTNREMLAKHGGLLLSRTRGGTVGGAWDKFPEVSAAILALLERTGFFAP